MKNKYRVEIYSGKTETVEAARFSTEKSLNGLFTVVFYAMSSNPVAAFSDVKSVQEIRSVDGDIR
jgi:hypothetical protein